ncbi:hypothetical protein NXS19_009955 [Fusarium pseudograminearum]|nr:hypothetical protein NXS19_009955 [Fusarium pseudograminearum]
MTSKYASFGSRLRRSASRAARAMIPLINKACDPFGENGSFLVESSFITRYRLLPDIELFISDRKAGVPACHQNVNFCGPLFHYFVSARRTVSTPVDKGPTQDNALDTALLVPTTMSRQFDELFLLLTPTDVELLAGRIKSRNSAR